MSFALALGSARLKPTPGAAQTRLGSEELVRPSFSPLQPSSLDSCLALYLLSCLHTLLPGSLYPRASCRDMTPRDSVCHLDWLQLERSLRLWPQSPPDHILVYRNCITTLHCGDKNSNADLHQFPAGCWWGDISIGHCSGVNYAPQNSYAPRCLHPEPQGVCTRR